MRLNAQNETVIVIHSSWLEQRKKNVLCAKSVVFELQNGEKFKK